MERSGLLLLTSLCIMLVVLGALLTGCVTGLAWTMAPSAGEAANLSPIEIGWMMNAIILGGVVCQYPLGYLADHLPRDYIVAGVATFCTLTSMSLFLVSFSPAAFIAAMFLLGGSSLTLYALCAAVADGLSAISKVEIADILLFCNGVGSVVSPFLVGFLAEHVNNAMFLVCGISMMVLAVVAVLSKNQPSADVIQLHLAHRHQVEWDEVG